MGTAAPTSTGWLRLIACIVLVSGLAGCNRQGMPADYSFDQPDYAAAAGNDLSN